jgi:hypothetical protein
MVIMAQTKQTGFATPSAADFEFRLRGFVRQKVLQFQSNWR